MSSVIQDGPSPKGCWSLLAPYAAQPVAASFAIVPAFRDLVRKSAEQRGEPVPKLTAAEWLKGGFKMAPTVGATVGSQMLLQMFLEKVIAGESNKDELTSKFASSAVVGILSSPFLAVINGQSMGWSVMKSLRLFSVRQGLAISVQETAFVGGLSAADHLSGLMKEKFGDNKGIVYFAAFTSGALGSLAGHPANTALTRWQSDMPVENMRQLMWGASKKARAIGTFAVFYKFGKESLNPSTKGSQ
jgi:hypothetical protein